MKKTLAGAVAGLLVGAGLLVAPASAAPAADAAVTPTFTDVVAFADEIAWAAEAGITTGYPDGTFRPAQPVTREAMAAFLYRFDGSPAWTPPAVSPFTDVTPASPFYDEITWLHDQGITTGTANGDGTSRFSPRGHVTREAMAAFVYRFAGSPEFVAPEESGFTDVGDSTVFRDEILWLTENGIAEGYVSGEGTASEMHWYGTWNPTTRQATVVYLYRLDALLPVS